MASLTHVCMWSKDGWKKISAKEAAILHPGGTVSSHSGLFMCELCGQYVLLTDEGYQVRHFRHSSYEKSKSCPERISGGGRYEYNSNEHELPIRIVGITSNSFYFELGLIRVPENLLNENIKIEIKSDEFNSKPFLYSKERINYNSISYVPIGDIPCTKYYINVLNCKNEIYDYWSREIKGIDSSGTIFETPSGRKLPVDSDIKIGKEYYYLSSWNYFMDMSDKDISVKKISSKQISGFGNLYLYSITANSMNENAAKFFLNHHYRLTEKAISIQPIWPPYVEDSYVIKHNQDNVWLHIKGNASTLKTFPSTSTIPLVSYSNSKLYMVNCQKRQQLISTGRINALKYIYFWKEPITTTNFEPEISVTDITGKAVISGETSNVPANGVLRIKSDYDGEIIIKQNDCIIEKRKIEADRIIEIDSMTVGKSVYLYAGLDCVWKLIINKLPKRRNDIDEVFVSKVINSKGIKIKPPHSLKNIALHYHSNSKLYKWILNCIKADKISGSAFRILETAYLRRNIK